MVICCVVRVRAVEIRHAMELADRERRPGRQRTIVRPVAVLRARTHTAMRAAGLPTSRLVRVETVRRLPVGSSAFFVTSPGLVPQAAMLQELHKVSFGLVQTLVRGARRSINAWVLRIPRCGRVLSD